MKIRAVAATTCFLINCFLLTGLSMAQEAYRPISGQSMISLQRDTISQEVHHFQNSRFLTYPAAKYRVSATPPPLAVIRGQSDTAPQIYSYHELGIFCKLEVQLERAAKMPIKIRLGEVQYVDWLEGKREAPVNGY